MPENTTNSTNPQKKSLSLWTKIKIFFFIIVLLAFTITGSLIYAMINPSSNFAQFAQKYLGFNYVISNKSELSTSQNSSTSTSSSTESSSKSTTATGENKILNNLLGLGTDQTIQNPSKFIDSPSQPNSTEKIVEQVLPSVVSISVQTNRGAFGDNSIVAGTGFFVSDEGLIMTNKHVIAQLCTIKSNQIQVLATDYQNKAWETTLVSVDPTTDLAILKIKDPGTTKFSKVTFYPTQNLKLGMDVIAIGNALGELKNSVTAGIVSGTGRNIAPAEADECGGYSAFSDGLIQTDAAINNGNSGGPLFNSSGALIGVNTFKGANAQSIGFSIPADEVSKTLNSYLKNGKISKPSLGVTTLPISATFKAQYSQIPVDYGAIIGSMDATGTVFTLSPDSIAKDSAAEKAGLQPGDIILKINDDQIKGSDENVSLIRKAISKYEPGTKIKITLLKGKTILEKSPEGKVYQTISYDATPVEIEATLGSLDSPI